MSRSFSSNPTTDQKVGGFKSPRLRQLFFESLNAVIFLFAIRSAWHTTRQHWIDHVEKPTVKEILAGVEGKLERDVEVYELYNVPTGTSGKGSLAQAAATA